MKEAIATAIYQADIGARAAAEAKRARVLARKIATQALQPEFIPEYDAEPVILKESITDGTLTGGTGASAKVASDETLPKEDVSKDIDENESCSILQQN